MKINEKIQYLRKEKNLLQKDLAKVLNVYPSAVSKWEIGENEPDIKTIVALAKFFDVTTDYLLGLED